MDGWKVNLPLGMAHFQGKVLVFSRVYTQEKHRKVVFCFSKGLDAQSRISPLIHWNPRKNKTWDSLVKRCQSSAILALFVGWICAQISPNLWRMSCVQFFAASMAKDHPPPAERLPLGPRMFFCSSWDVFVVEPYLACFKQIQIWDMSTCFFWNVSNYQWKLHGKKQMFDLCRCFDTWVER